MTRKLSLPRCTMCNRATRNTQYVTGRCVCVDCNVIYNPLMVAGLKVLPVLIIALLMISTAAAYQVDNSGYAYIDDGNAEIRAPLLITGPNPTLTGYARPKVYDGDIRVAFGFNKDVWLPTKGGYFETQIIEQAFTCDTTGGSRSYTNINGVISCYLEENGTQTLLWSTPYDRVDLGSETVYLDVAQKVYTPGSSAQKFSYNFDDKDTWYLLPPVSVAPDRPFTYEFTGDVPLGESAKYDVAIFPAAYPATPQGIQNAIANGHFYYLDPFVNALNYEVGNLTNVSNGWDNDVNSLLSTVTIDPQGKTFSYGAIVEDAIAWYDFDTGSGDYVIDRTGSGLNAHIRNATWDNFTYSVDFANSVEFDGVNDYLRTNASLSGLDYFSVLALINIDGCRDMIVEDGFSPLIFRAWVNQNCRLEVYTRNSLGTIDNTQTTGLVSVGSWQTIAVTYDQDRAPALNGSDSTRLFINGIEDATNGNMQFGLDVNTAGINIGTQYAQTNTNDFDGHIQQLILFNRTLTNGEVNDWHNNIMLHPGIFGAQDSLNLYVSDVFSINTNVTSFVYDLVVTGDNASWRFNYSCDGVNYGSIDNATSGAAVCSVGDTFEYTIELFGTAPVAQNLSISFAPNNPPVIGSVVFIPAAPDTDDNTLSASVVYSDNESQSGTVNFSWFVDGDSVRNQTVAVLPGAEASDTLDISTLFAGDVIVVSVVANDGLNNSNVVQDSVVLAAAAVSVGGLSDEAFIEGLVFASLILFTVLCSYLAIRENAMIYAIPAGIGFITLIGMLSRGVLELFSSYQSDLILLLLVGFCAVVGVVLGSDK